MESKKHVLGESYLINECCKLTLVGYNVETDSTKRSITNDSVQKQLQKVPVVEAAKLEYQLREDTSGKPTAKLFHVSLNSVSLVW